MVVTWPVEHSVLCYGPETLKLNGNMMKLQDKQGAFWPGYCPMLYTAILSFLSLSHQDPFLCPTGRLASMKNMFGLLGQGRQTIIPATANPGGRFLEEVQVAVDGVI